jgi:hypothetical protein
VGRSLRGLAQFISITRFCAKEHRARVDGRATARHLHGKIERAARCLTVRVSAESAGAVASNVFFESLTTQQSGRLAQPDGGAGAPAGRGYHTFRVGRHHHRGPLHEGRGLTHALAHIAPTDLAPSGGARACGAKPVNLRTCGLVSDSVAIVQAFAELRYGAVIHTRENGVK